MSILVYNIFLNLSDFLHLPKIVCPAHKELKLKQIGRIRIQKNPIHTKGQLISVRILSCIMPWYLSKYLAKIPSLLWLWRKSNIKTAGFFCFLDKNWTKDLQRQNLNWRDLIFSTTCTKYLKWLVETNIFLLPQQFLGQKSLKIHILEMISLFEKIFDMYLHKQLLNW